MNQLQLQTSFQICQVPETLVLTIQNTGRFLLRPSRSVWLLLKWAFVVIALLGAGTTAVALEVDGVQDDDYHPQQRNLTEWKYASYTSRNIVLQ